MISRSRQHPLAAIEIPTLVLSGGTSHPAMQRANALLFESMSRAALATIDGAAHFMIATHVAEVSRLIGEHVDGIESCSISRAIRDCVYGDALSSGPE
jgi:pimeloyl-ACP methyl ester carboxylesterase